MPRINAPGIGLGYGWNHGESGVEVKQGLDENFLTTSVLMNLSVKSRATALPGSPSNGDIYIVPAGAGANANKVAARSNGQWHYFTPKRNWEARVEDEGDAKVRFTGTAWVEVEEGSGGGGGGGPTMAVATLTEVVQTPNNTTSDKDVLTLNIPPEDLYAGLTLEVLMFGTQSQAATSQNLVFYAKVNGGAAITIGQVGAGASAQSYRAISGKALMHLLAVGTSGSYTLGGDFMINGLVPYSSNSGSPRTVNTTSGFSVTIGVRNTVADEANFENITAAVIKQIA